MNLSNIKDLVIRLSKDYKVNPINVCLLDDYKSNQSSIILILSEKDSKQGHYVLYLQNTNPPLYFDPYGKYPSQLFLKYPKTMYNEEKLYQLFNDLLQDPTIVVNTNKIQTTSSLCGPLCLIFYIVYCKVEDIKIISNLLKKFKEIYKVSVEDYINTLINNNNHDIYYSIKKVITNLLNIYNHIKTIKKL